MNVTCNSDNKSDPSYFPINIRVVKSRIGKLKETNKQFWEFSRSKHPLFLKRLRENVKTMRLVRKLREPMM